MLPERSHLRRVTRVAHERVDAAFGNFALATPKGYSSFLQAHDIALAWVAGSSIVEVGPLRGHIAADLADQGQRPWNIPFVGPRTRGHGLGVGYVLAGSHFGAQLLVRDVLRGMPNAPRVICGRMS